jgi:uncharacterized repeat protein (TIGR03803 family)
MFMVALLCLAGCGGGGGSTSGTTGGNGGMNTGGSSTNAVLVSIDTTPANPSLAVGKQVKLIITGHLSDGTTTSSVAPPFFSSSAPTVAPVDQAGNVSALAIGSTTITVTVNAITTTTIVTVTAGLASVSYLYSFGLVQSDGVQPAGFIQASDGNFYGSTMAGGAGNACSDMEGSCGAIFKMTPAGNETVLYSFGANISDGYWPDGLIQASDGNFYGTTVDGGTYGYGTFFKLTLDGVETLLYSFGASPSDGITPLGLVAGSDGNFYGITSTGGANSCVQTPGAGNNCGTVFKLTPAGVETILYNFGANATDGVEPNGLILANDGNLYGTTASGGTNACGDLPGETSDCGTLFKVTLDGSETVLFSFGGDPLNGSSPHGSAPQGVLFQGSDGNLYGATVSGGANGLGCGVVYRMTLTGTESVLYSFGSSNPDGCGPNGLIQGADGNFYGTTSSGGAFGGDLAGIAYELTPAGVETVLYSFGPLNIAPSQPHGLLQGSDGNFYGLTTYSFPGSGAGSVFRLVLTH